MARIIHIALKVEDLENATKFYEDVFGLRQTGTGYARGHVSRHMTDGALDVALMVYENVFGFEQVATGRNGQHISRHMTDGVFDLALMVYDSKDAEEAQLAGPGPRIHHWGIEVDDRDGFAEKIARHGGTLLSKPESM